MKKNEFGARLKLNQKTPLMTPDPNGSQKSQGSLRITMMMLLKRIKTTGLLGVTLMEGRP